MYNKYGFCKFRDTCKGNMMKNNVKILPAAWGQTCARKDTLDPAKGTTPKRDVSLEVYIKHAD